MSHSKSITQKKLEGTFRPDRDKGTADPQGKLSSPPPPPEDLTGIAADIWNETTLYLTKNRILHQSDLPLLKCYCLSYQKYIRLTEYLQANGDTYTNAGLVKLRPESKLRLSEFDQMSKLANLYYLSPRSRESMPPLEGPPVLDQFDYITAPDQNDFETFEAWRDSPCHRVVL